MHLMYYLDADNKRVYTLKKETPDGKITESAHPARFSPDDKFSRQRISCKKRFGIYMPHTPEKPLWLIIEKNSLSSHQLNGEERGRRKWTVVFFKRHDVANKYGEFY